MQLLVSPLSPYRFGHYYLYSLDYTNHRYKVVSFINNTSQDAQVAIPHFMYQAIMRNEFGSSFSYTMINDPMPIVQIYKDRNKSSSGFFIIFVLGIAFALIPTSIIGFLLNEKANALVHQQIISGMNKVSYWISNFTYDIVKVFVPILMTIAFLYIFSLDYDYAWLLIFLFPTAIVPYTYFTSFLFNDEAAGQNFTIIHNFLIGGLLPIAFNTPNHKITFNNNSIAFNVLRLIDSTKTIGDGLVWLPRIFPIYNVCNGIVMISLKDTIANMRNESTPTAISFSCAGGDVMFFSSSFLLLEYSCNFNRSWMLKLFEKKRENNHRCCWRNWYDEVIIL